MDEFAHTTKGEGRSHEGVVVGEGWCRCEMKIKGGGEGSEGRSVAFRRNGFSRLLDVAGTRGLGHSRDGELV